MFTGLIRELGKITSLQKFGGGGVLSLKAHGVSSDAKVGDSVSVNGVCLTVVNVKDSELSFDLSGETLRSSNLGELMPADLVNIEPSLTAETKIGGHFVTGHVDAVGSIRSKLMLGDMTKIEIQAPANIIDYLVRKGSVAVDGISLTVVDILKDGFTVVIIPHTAKVTTLGFKGSGDNVNIETDILGKYVVKFLKKDIKDKRDMKFFQTLQEEGYI